MIKCPSGLVTSQRLVTPSRSRCKRSRAETKCGSGLAQQCVEAAGKIPHSLPHIYLLQRPEDEVRKPLWSSQRFVEYLSGMTKTARSRCRGSTA
ncbi:hypothetical protein DY000_02062653 [Brassica cretica]|uniref:Uncharacterized protein n=1 Tax=Brassica cretica TaxID=69181 RepID=A0ABQ7AYW1_BRACR|nr:hypothetical protein DY000_02062653 [Brassica cretica]